jgi:hypothetical protein
MWIAHARDDGSRRHRADALDLQQSARGLAQFCEFADLAFILRDVVIELVKLLKQSGQHFASERKPARLPLYFQSDGRRKDSTNRFTPTILSSGRRHRRVCLRE